MVGAAGVCCVCASLRRRAHLSGNDDHKRPATVALDVWRCLPEELHKFAVVVAMQDAVIRLGQAVAVGRCRRCDAIIAIAAAAAVDGRRHHLGITIVSSRRNFGHELSPRGRRAGRGEEGIRMALEACTAAGLRPAGRSASVRTALRRAGCATPTTARIVKALETRNCPQKVQGRQHHRLGNTPLAIRAQDRRVHNPFTASHTIQCVLCRERDVRRRVQPGNAVVGSEDPPASDLGARASAGYAAFELMRP